MKGKHWIMSEKRRKRALEDYQKVQHILHDTYQFQYFHQQCELRNTSILDVGDPQTS
jgi:hypothetical protein